MQVGLCITFHKFFYFPFITVFQPSYIAVNFILDVNIFMFVESVTDLICKALPTYVRVELHSVCLSGTSHQPCSCFYTHICSREHQTDKQFNRSFQFITCVQQSSIYVNNCLFLVAFLHVSMFARHQQGVSYNVC